jgi:hypothetical protein
MTLESAIGAIVTSALEIDCVTSIISLRNGCEGDLVA